MKYAFISGIPASGKSYLARRVAQKLGISHIAIDNWRNEIKTDPKMLKWVDFFWNQDEEKYWQSTSCKEQWENLKNQSEAFWPTILTRIKEIQKTGKPAIFEGVNILPHLARRDLNFEGVVLLGESFETIFARNKEQPRWGKTEALQRREAEAFYNCERPMYEEEARQYNYKSFTNSDSAELELVKILGTA